MNIFDESKKRFLLEKEYLGNSKPVNLLEPLVSVTVTTYQHVNYIRECLDGILLQKTTFSFELIVGEDESVDGTREICIEYAEKYPDKIRLFLRDRKTSQYYNEDGIFVTRFNGLWNRMSARGKYIAWCEGDDYWTDPCKLQKQVDFLENNTDVVAVITNSSICDLNGKVINSERLVIPPANKEGEYTLHDFFKNNHHYPTLTAIFRNKNMENTTRQLISMSNPFLGDWTLWVLLHLQGNFYFMNQVTASYRINPTSLTHTVNAIKRWEADFIIRKKLVEILPVEYHKYLKSNFNTYFKLSMAYRKDKQTKMFIYYQICSIISNPFLYVKRIFETFSVTKQ